MPAKSKKKPKRTVRKPVVHPKETNGARANTSVLHLVVTTDELAALQGIKDRHNHKILMMGLLPTATVNSVLRTLIIREAAKIGLMGPLGESRKPKPDPEPAPRIIDAIQVVMGKKTMNASEIYNALEKLRWIPVSKDPMNYIRFTLSSEGETFIRSPKVRGFYHLSKKNPFYYGRGTPRPPQFHPANAP